MTGFCSNCGNPLPPAARFCSACGTAVVGAPPAAAYAPYQPPYQPRLVRPLFGRQFAGVCAGLARTYGWDVGMVRIVTVVTAIFLFPFPEILYLAGWVGIPEEPLTEVPYQSAPPYQTAPPPPPQQP